MDHIWRKKMTHYQLSPIDNFAENQFPETWQEWFGVGLLNTNNLKEHGIESPIELLGKFLLMKKDTFEFYNYLRSCKIQNVKMITLQLLSWCEFHKL